MHRNPLKMLPTWSLEASKTSQNLAKGLPRRPKMDPKRLQEAPKPLQDAPSSSQDAPKTFPRRPKHLQERSRSPQVAPKAFQDASKTLCNLIFGCLGKVRGRFSRSMLWPPAANTKPSLIPSSNPKFQSQHVNRLFSTDVLYG